MGFGQSYTSFTVVILLLIMPRTAGFVKTFHQTIRQKDNSILSSISAHTVSATATPSITSNLTKSVVVSIDHAIVEGYAHRIETRQNDYDVKNYNADDSNADIDSKKVDIDKRYTVVNVHKRNVDSGESNDDPNEKTPKKASTTLSTLSTLSTPSTIQMTTRPNTAEYQPDTGKAMFGLDLEFVFDGDFDKGHEDEVKQFYEPRLKDLFNTSNSLRSLTVAPSKPIEERVILTVETRFSVTVIQSENTTLANIVVAVKKNVDDGGTELNFESMALNEHLTEQKLREAAAKAEDLTDFCDAVGICLNGYECIYRNRNKTVPSCVDKCRLNNRCGSREECYYDDMKSVIACRCKNSGQIDSGCKDEDELTKADIAGIVLGVITAVAAIAGVVVGIPNNLFQTLFRITCNRHNNQNAHSQNFGSF